MRLLGSSEVVMLLILGNFLKMHLAGSPSSHNLDRVLQELSTTEEVGC